MIKFICPVCGKTLTKREKIFTCPECHSFDIAKSGYTNLLLNSGRGRHGDDKLMVKARSNFLSKGYYLPLAKEVANLSERYTPQLIIDAGCGEGYYTDYVSKICLDADIVGFDISKEAVSAAAKKCRGMFAAASTASMPVADECADLILNIFSPFFPKEFARVLKSGGIIIRVIPLEKHLHEFRETIYDNPYDNTVPELQADKFEIAEKRELKYTIEINNNEDIQNLFMMTPYYYKTSEKDQAKILKKEKLKTRIEFGIVVYKRIKTDL